MHCFASRVPQVSEHAMSVDEDSGEDELISDSEPEDVRSFLIVGRPPLTNRLYTSFRTGSKLIFLHLVDEARRESPRRTPRLAPRNEARNSSRAAHWSLNASS